MTVRILLADDNAELVAAAREALSLAPGLAVVATAGTGETALQAAAGHHPDVAVVDVTMPGGGPELVRDLVSMIPGLRVMALTARDDEETVLAMLAAGATGFVSKAVLDEDLATCVRRCGEGMFFVVAGSADRVRERFAHLWAAR